MLIDSIPYFSHLKITYVPTNNLIDTGRVAENGKSVLQVVTDRPGVVVEVTPYLGEDEFAIAGPAVQMDFPLKSFLTDGKKAFEAIEQSDATKKIIESIDKDLNDPSVNWAESLILATGGENITDLWSNIILESLEEFPQWSGASKSDVGGFKLEAKVMQLDARIPAIGSKSITVKIGLQAIQKGKPVGQMIYSELSFLDAAGVSNRKATISQLETAVADLQVQLASAKTEQKPIFQNDIDIKKNQIFEMKKQCCGSMASLLSQPKVVSDLESLFLEVIKAMKKDNPAIDVEKVALRTKATLASIIAAELPAA